MKMKRKSRCLLLISVFLVAIAGFSDTSPEKTATVPPMKFMQRTLPNGLQVLTLQDKFSPTVSVQVWYRVGSKDDPEGRSGFAHLFEHLMFKSTKHMKDEMMDRLTEDVGGSNNASTWDDFTEYHEVDPSNYLEPLLWAEAERMSSLNVNEKNFPAERDVVKEEFRQSYLARPYGMLFYFIDKRSFSVHPYRRPGIGNVEELDAANLDDVKKFHATYYRPDNALLLVVGDFEQTQVDSWIDKYFGPIPKPNIPLPRVTLKEPERREAKQYDEYRPNVPLPAIAITYLTPPIASTDTPAFRVAESILSSGESSRLYQALVYRQQIAQDAWADADLRKDAGLFILGAIAAGGKSISDLEQAIRNEIKRMQDEPVSDAELAKAKNQLVTDALRDRETNNGKASSLAYAAVMLGDPARTNTEIEELQTVTANQIQNVMRKYTADKNAVAIHYLDESLKKSIGAKKEKSS